MTLVRWDPFRELSRLFSDMPAASGRDDVPGAWAPRVDILEQDDALVLRAELPGIGKDDLDVRVEDGLLILEGERKREREEEQHNVYRRERLYGRFARSFRLPTTVDTSKVTATYKDGMLEVHVPKLETARPRKVEIHAA